MHALETLQIYYNYSKSSDVYRDVVGIILQNLDKMKDSTIYDVAEMCFVSPTTISRLSKRLGYHNFQDFKSNLNHTLKNYETLNRYVGFMHLSDEDNVLETYFKQMESQIAELKKHLSDEKLEEMADFIAQSHKIHFYTNGIVFAEYRFQADLIVTGHPCEIKNSQTDQLKDIPNLTENDLVILYAPIVLDANDMYDIMRAVKKQGARLFVVTDTYFAQCEKYADYYYWFHGVMAIIDDYHYAMLLNLLSITFRNKYL